MGADNLISFHKWLKWKQISEKCQIIVFDRMGFKSSSLKSVTYKKLGKNRLNRISRWQSFIDSGCKIPGGSDCPIEDGNPLFEYYAAVTRQDHNGFPESGWQNQECINRMDALKMLTTWGAYGEFAENKRGQIKIGYNGDLTVLSNDLLNCDDKNILNTEILMTIIDGKILKNIL